MVKASDVPPTWEAQLNHAEGILARAGSPAPRAEAVELLGALLGVPAALLAAQPASVMSWAEVEAYAAWVARRAEGEALAHITGHLEFMGLDVAVGPTGPLPAPGARRLVEVALRWARQRPPGELSAVEVGTGCGAIALAMAALEPRFTRIYAMEVSPEGLETARANGARYLLNLVINWLEGDGLDVVPDPVDLIVRGLIEPDASPSEAGLKEEAAQEPRPIGRGLEMAPAKLAPGGALICGCAGSRQGAVVAALARMVPAAYVWVESQPGDSMVIIVAQLPRDSARQGAF